MVILISSFPAVMPNMCRAPPISQPPSFVAASGEQIKYLVHCTLIDINLQTVGVAGEGDDGML